MSCEMQEWRRDIDGFNMLEQPQPYFATFKVRATPALSKVRSSAIRQVVRTPGKMSVSAELYLQFHVVQDFFDHGVMAMTRKGHPVWVIKVSSHCIRPRM